MAEIDEYLAGLDSENAKIIGDAYATARTLVPEAEQGISYGMPALIFHSRPLLSLMRAKSHIGIYPYSAVVVAAVLETLPAIDGLSAAKGTVRLPLGAEIPEIVIRQLVLARSDEIRAAVAKKPTARPRVVKHAE
ncbi:MAG TPA: DUF1801 domain-containing protein [Propionibacteriaceae bacterium]